MPAETDFAPPSGLAQLAPGVEVTATCPSATGARRALTVRRLARRPHLYHLRNVLSAAECDRLVAAAAARESGSSLYSASSLMYRLPSLCVESYS